MSSGSDGCFAHDPRRANTLRFLTNIPSIQPSPLLIYARRPKPTWGTRSPALCRNPTCAVRLGPEGLAARSQQSCCIFCSEDNSASQCRSIKLRHAQLVAAFGGCPQSQRSIWRTRFWSWFPLTRRPMICTRERDTGRNWIQVFHRYRQESATPTQYLHGNADLAT
jgi:hypothetical protein